MKLVVMTLWIENLRRQWPPLPRSIVVTTLKLKYPISVCMCVCVHFWRQVHVSQQIYFSIPIKYMLQWWQLDQSGRFGIGQTTFSDFLGIKKVKMPLLIIQYSQFWSLHVNIWTKRDLRFLSATSASTFFKHSDHLYCTFERLAFLVGAT